MVTENKNAPDPAATKSRPAKANATKARKAAKKSNRATKATKATKPTKAAKPGAAKAAKRAPRAAAKKPARTAAKKRAPTAARKAPPVARAKSAIGIGVGKQAAALMKRMAALQAKLDAINQRERGSVLEQIRHAVERFSFTAAELFSGKPVARLLASAGRKRAATKRAATKPGAAKRAAPVKYRDGDNTWAGRGKRPAWLTERLAAGAKLEDFAV
ncbi:MAG: H-NS family nucleoid-associated regulatory protein [Lautropia sp.]